MNCAKTLESSLIDYLQEQGHLLAVDVSAANYLSDHKSKSEKLLLLFSFLFASARMGHLCIKIDENILPPIEQVWPIEDPDLLKDCQINLQMAFKELADSFLAHNPNLKKSGKYLYLQKNFFYEKEIAAYFKKLDLQKPFLKIEDLELSHSLSDEQSEAIIKSLASSLSFIVGGPGVGKTFTANALIEAFLRQFPKARVSVVAPTGKAIANLQKGLFELIENQNYDIQTNTLHKLFYKKIDSFLPFDLIVVDESSMIDAHFFLKLLKYNRRGSRLVFLGDPNQLPPIGSGSIFRDLLEICCSKSTLQRCLRTDIKEIVSCGELVQKGDKESFFQVLEGKAFFNELTTKNELLIHLLNSLVTPNEKHSDYQKLELLQKYKILTAMKKGEFGADSINQAIKQHLDDASCHPIIVTSNDYNLDLFNGDMGFLNRKGEAIFLSRGPKQRFICEDERIRRLPAALLPSYDLAYCLSIHKSQGSEYEKVSIVLPPKSELFGRELLYTAITRAKKEFEIFSDKHTLTKLVNNQCVRLSGLSETEDK